MCYNEVVASSTSSYRIPDDLKQRLERTSQRMDKGKNWILTQALSEYLDRHDFEALRAEARRQSILASRTKWKDEALWEKAAAEVLSESDG